jgi:micrococcal nuclease
MKRILLLTLVIPTSPLKTLHSPLPPPGTSFSGTVRYVGDGDSICVERSSNAFDMD